VTREGGNGVDTLITRLVILHSDWSSGSRDSNVVLHWSYLHSFSRRVTDICRRLTSPFRGGSRVKRHCLRRRVFRLSHPECRSSSEAVGRHAGDAWDLTLPEPSERRRRSSVLMRRLPSRCPIPDRTELVRSCEFGSWLSQCSCVREIRWEVKG